MLPLWYLLTLLGTAPLPPQGPMWATPAPKRMLDPQNPSLCRRGKSRPSIGMATTLSHTSGKNLICWVLPPDLARPTERAGGSGGLGFLASLCLVGQAHRVTHSLLGWSQCPGPGWGGGGS